ncbi:MAG: dihydroorotate dehydrogenase [archaeon]|nr:dihydroorotate dehydrogenase [archaeon]
MAGKAIRKRQKETSNDQENLSTLSFLETELCGFKIHSPTMLASGVLGISFDLFPRIIESGCGVIVSKSIGLEPREGYGNPTMTGVEAGYLNAIGLANPGSEEFARELEEEFSKKPVPLIVSIFADSAEHFADLVKRFDRFNFLAYELNLSCPHVKDVGSEIGSEPADAAEVVKVSRSATGKPIFAKMPATIINVPEWAKAVESAGADAIVAINTIRAMKIDLESKKPVLSNKIGGLSGPAIKPVAVRSVYEIYETVKIPIVGVGGIVSGEDAVEFFLAGASAVEIGSAIGQDYLDSFERVNTGVMKYLKRNSYSNVKEIVGLAHY